LVTAHAHSDQHAVNVHFDGVQADFRGEKKTTLITHNQTKRNSAEEKIIVELGKRRINCRGRGMYNECITKRSQRL